MSETHDTHAHPHQACTCGCMGVGPMITQFLKAVGPSERVAGHFRAAHVEVLKGLRAMLDDQIAQHQPAESQGTRIPVE